VVRNLFHATVLAFGLLPTLVCAKSFSCDELDQIIRGRLVNRGAVTTSVMVYASWNGEPYKLCSYNPSEQITDCGGKRFLSKPSNMMLGFPVISKSGTEVDSVANSKGTRLASCEVFENSAIVITTTEREFILKNLPIRYSLREIKRQTYPISSMQF
jgi:hypothetical protein